VTGSFPPCAPAARVRPVGSSSGTRAVHDRRSGWLARGRVYLGFVSPFRYGKPQSGRPWLTPRWSQPLIRGDAGMSVGIRRDRRRPVGGPSGSVVLIATLQRGEPAPEELTALWKDGLVERPDVSGLSRAETQDLVTSVHSGPILGSTLRQLWDVAHGNVLFLREVVQAALRAGDLRRTMAYGGCAAPWSRAPTDRNRRAAAGEAIR
jgi:hypothetical protein